MEGGLFGQNCEEVSDEVSKGRAARHTRVERLWWGERERGRGEGWGGTWILYIGT